jgi:hypothetical protein
MTAAITVSAGRTRAAAKNFFFDRERVARAVDKATRKHLNWFGGYARKVARSSLKAKKGISSPGSPPFVHANYRRTHKVTKGKRVELPKPQKRYSFKDSVLYSFEPEAKTVVIGPVLFNGAKTSPTVPELLEKGGTTTVTRGGATFTANYRPRPFMAPAFETTKTNFMKRLKDSVK